MRAGRRRLSGWWLPLAVGMAAACATGGSGTLPPPPQMVTVAMREYRFDYKSFIAPGRAVFVVENRGRESHQLSMAALPPDFPSIDAQLRGSERRSLPPLATTPNVAPGQKWVFAVDLVPGTRYALLCFVHTPDGKLHALEGMNSEFRTPEAGS